MVQRVGRGIALLFQDRGTRRGEWSAARPGRTLSLGMTQYPFYRRLGVPQGRSRRVEYLVPTGIRSRTVQCVVSHYTDRVTRPFVIWGGFYKLIVVGNCISSTDSCTSAVLAPLLSPCSTIWCEISK